MSARMVHHVTKDLHLLLMLRAACRHLSREGTQLPRAHLLHQLRFLVDHVHPALGRHIPKAKLQLNRHLKACTTDISLHNE